MTIFRTYEIYPWLSVTPTSGTVAPGTSETITVNCDGSQMPLGDYEGTIFITSNDPDFPVIEIPVNFHVDYALGIAAEHYLNPRISHYPNPFSEQVVITLELKQPALVILEIYDALGEKIETIVNGKFDEGTHYFSWDGKDRQGIKMNAGIYFYRLNACGLEKVEKLLLVD